MLSKLLAKYGKQIEEDSVPFSGANEADTVPCARSRMALPFENEDDSAHRMCEVCFVVSGQSHATWMSGRGYRRVSPAGEMGTSASVSVTNDITSKGPMRLPLLTSRNVSSTLSARSQH